MKMDPFIRRLVERMLDPSRPLSRNRHFHTFATPEGKRASRISRRLLALQKDIAACVAQGGAPLAVRVDDGGGAVRVEVRLERIRTAHRATLDDAEFELLCRLPGVRQTLLTRE
jgi:hypothetical protein